MLPLKVFIGLAHLWPFGCHVYDFHTVYMIFTSLQDFHAFARPSRVSRSFHALGTLLPMLSLCFFIGLARLVPLGCFLQDVHVAHDLHVFHDFHAFCKTSMLSTWFPRSGSTVTCAFPIGFNRVGASGAFRVPCVRPSRCSQDFHDCHTTFTLSARPSRLSYDSLFPPS